MKISGNMFLSVCVIACAVRDITGKKQGYACLQENMYLWMHLWEYENRYNFIRNAKIGILDAQSKMVNIIYVALLMFQWKAKMSEVKKIYIYISK